MSNPQKSWSDACDYYQKRAVALAQAKVIARTAEQDEAIAAQELAAAFRNLPGADFTQFDKVKSLLASGFKVTPS